MRLSVVCWNIFNKKYKKNRQIKNSRVLNVVYLYMVFVCVILCKNGNRVPSRESSPISRLVVI